MSTLSYLWEESTSIRAPHPGDREALMAQIRVRGVAVGDRLKVSGDTNRARRRVVAMPSDCWLSFEVYLRPSRGFRKFVRRAKAAARRA